MQAFYTQTNRLEMQRLKNVFQRVIPWLIMLASVYVLLVAVGAIGVGFRQLCGGKEGVASLFVFATRVCVGKRGQ